MENTDKAQTSFKAAPPLVAAHLPPQASLHIRRKPPDGLAQLWTESLQELHPLSEDDLSDAMVAFLEAVRHHFETEDEEELLDRPHRPTGIGTRAESNGRKGFQTEWRRRKPSSGLTILATGDRKVRVTVRTDGATVQPLPISTARYNR